MNTIVHLTIMMKDLTIMMKENTKYSLRLYALEKNKIIDD